MRIGMQYWPYPNTRMMGTGITPSSWTWTVCGLSQTIEFSSVSSTPFSTEWEWIIPPIQVTTPPPLRRRRRHRHATHHEKDLLPWWGKGTQLIAAATTLLKMMKCQHQQMLTTKSETATVGMSPMVAKLNRGCLQNTKIKQWKSPLFKLTSK